MSKTPEASYYEIALTNRQVVMAFILLLASLLGSFLAGVWLGREQWYKPRSPVEEASAAAADKALPDIEELTFFDKDQPEDGANRPDLGRLREGGSQTTLAEDVGAVKPAPPPPTAPPTLSEPVIIQVFSTRDDAQARKVLQRLRRGGYRAFLSPVQVRDETMYRVRIGPFEDRQKAQTVSQKIESELDYDTWITAAGN